jgi:hypothetical protein
MFSAMSVLDVPGNKPGSESADLEYGVTLHMVGRPGMMDVASSIKSVTAATRVLEGRAGKDLVGDNEPKPAIEAAFAGESIPAGAGGKAIESTVTVPVVFKLDNQN